MTPIQRFAEKHVHDDSHKINSEMKIMMLREERGVGKKLKAVW